MPVAADDSLEPFTAAEIAAMNIRTFDVRHGNHPTETREVDQNTMTRTFLVDWDERFNFVEHVIGRSKTFDDTGVRRISRLLPNIRVGRHPDLPGIVATKITSMKGAGGPGIDDINGMPAYPDAEVTVFYEQVPYRLRTDSLSLGDERRRYVWMNSPEASEIQRFGPLPGGMYKYVTAGGGAPMGDPVASGQTVFRPVQRFVIWWENLPFDVYATGGGLLNRLFFGNVTGGVTTLAPGYIGTVNSVEFAITALCAFPTESLLLEKVTPILQRSPLAADDFDGCQWRIGFHFAFSPISWLTILHPNLGTFELVTRDGVYYAAGAMPDNNSIFNLRDHNLLFNVNNV